jgi:predicted lipoprotein with Yx(FWY)xxD motif
VAAALFAGVGASVAGAADPTVQVGTNPTFGSILTTGTGMALYTLDTDQNGQSTCHGACAAVWPPLDVPAGTTPTTGPGVTGTVSTSRQADGTSQVTYNGAPLYTFVSDSSPGQVTGNDVMGFFVVKVAAPTTTTTAPATGSGAPPPTTAAPTTAATSSLGSSAPAPSAGSASTARTSSAAAPASTSTGTGSLAFTGVGPALVWLTLGGLVLVLVGFLLALSTGRRTEDAAS